MIRRLLGFLVVLVVLLLPNVARADCTDPVRPEGTILYNRDFKTAQFCDGTTWWAMKNGGGLPSCAEGETIILASAGWACGSTGGGGGTPCTDDATIECLLEAARSNDDPDFSAANIADGVNILGVTGTLTAGNGCDEGGHLVGGYCWYVGFEAQSCTTVCASHGGYNSATLTYAGSAGTDQNCQNVLDAFGAPASGMGAPSSAAGCYMRGSPGIGRMRGTTATTEGATAPDASRACACNN